MLMWKSQRGGGSSARNGAGTVSFRITEQLMNRHRPTPVRRARHSFPSPLNLRVVKLSVSDWIDRGRLSSCGQCTTALSVDK